MAAGEQVRYNITKSIWRLNRSVNGWQKEVNVVAWNGKQAKLDIREWNADKSQMHKGLTFDKDEVYQLKRCMASIDPEVLFAEKSTDDNTERDPGPAGIVNIATDSTTGNQQGNVSESAETGTDETKDTSTDNV